MKHKSCSATKEQQVEKQLGAGEMNKITWENEELSCIQSNSLTDGPILSAVPLATTKKWWWGSHMVRDHFVFSLGLKNFWCSLLLN